MRQIGLWMLAGVLGTQALPASGWTWVERPAWKLDLTGNWQYDTARIAVEGQPTRTAHQWRRQRLGMHLKGTRFEWQAEYDAHAQEWTDALLRVKQVAGGELLLGQFKQPFGLEELVSDKRSLLQESSLAGGFVVGRRVGLGWVWNPAAWGMQWSAYTHNLNGAAGSEGLALRGWHTWVPAEGWRVHLGAASVIERPEADRYSLSARPDTRLEDLRLARSGTLTDASGVRRWALEGLLQRGSLWMQGEWLGAHVDRRTQLNYTAQGGYLQAGWISGGAQRGYKQGVVQGVDRAGVLELGLRWSAVDLQNHGVRGGRAHAWSAAATWYVKPETRISLQYGHNDTQDPRAADVNLTQMRLQFVF